VLSLAQGAIRRGQRREEQSLTKPQKSGTSGNSIPAISALGSGSFCF